MMVIPAQHWRRQAPPVDRSNPHCHPPVNLLCCVRLQMRQWVNAAATSSASMWRRAAGSEKRGVGVGKSKREGSSVAVAGHSLQKPLCKCTHRRQWGEAKRGEGCQTAGQRVE